MHFKSLVSNQDRIRELFAQHDRALCAAPRISTVEFRSLGGDTVRLVLSFAPGQGLDEQCRALADLAGLGSNYRPVLIRQEG